MITGHLFRDFPAVLSEEEVVLLAQANGVRIERIVSRGQSSPEDVWYDQDTTEWVVLLQGAARLRIEHETEERDLQPGQWILLPAHCRHRVTWTDPAQDSVWLAIHLPAENP